ncbi:helix-turn-helix domain-containing protein [Nocardiopsis xinjiangensis]|uniref:helix-turn-helix domain-containing protein n=1 Tax=Nocardiopsis xinjiangensis TaxID=124285 RepID=UPI00034B4E5C|nr:XRE family transcriptional regulator [Nocardiopsis xinjiangensis]
MNDDDLGRVLDVVGPRLRDLRKVRELTLAHVSARTGISTSTLSRLESGGRRPTLELLLPLARVYDVPLDELVDAPRTGDPRIHPQPVTRGGQTIVPLTNDLGSLRAYKFVVPPPEGPLPPVDLQTHEGYDWLYVLSGQLLLHLGDQETLLRPGEAAEFDTRVPHAIRNPGPATTEFLTLFGPQGERVHLRARTVRN